MRGGLLKHFLIFHLVTLRFIKGQNPNAFCEESKVTHVQGQLYKEEQWVHVQESQFDKRKWFDSLKIRNVEQIQLKSKALKGMIHIYLKMSPPQYSAVSLFVKPICR